MSFLRHTVSSPLGRLECVAFDEAVVEIRFAGGEAASGVAASSCSGVLGLLEAQLSEYFEGRRRTFDVPLAPVGTVFQQQAWNALCTIPYGDTISYAEQARRTGRPRAARAVGGANARNPLPIVVPCHRVVGTSGRLVGFAGGLDRKAWLLEHEHRVMAR